MSGLKDDEGKNKRGAADDEDDVDWDALDSDQLDSDDLDRLERGEKIKSSETKMKNASHGGSGKDVIVSRGYEQDVGKKLLKDKQDKEKLAGMS